MEIEKDIQLEHHGYFHFCIFDLTHFFVLLQPYLLQDAPAEFTSGFVFFIFYFLKFFLENSPEIFVVPLIQVCNFLVGLFFLDLMEIFGVASVYTGFGTVALLAAIFAKYFIVETKGRSLEEIEMSLDPKFSVRDK